MTLSIQAGPDGTTRRARARASGARWADQLERTGSRPCAPSARAPPHAPSRPPAAPTPPTPCGAKACGPLTWLIILYVSIRLTLSLRIGASAGLRGCLGASSIGVGVAGGSLPAEDGPASEACAGACAGGAAPMPSTCMRSPAGGIWAVPGKLDMIASIVIACLLSIVTNPETSASWCW